MIVPTVLATLELPHRDVGTSGAKPSNYRANHDSDSFPLTACYHCIVGRMMI
jgi:hypothetical protein